MVDNDIPDDLLSGIWEHSESDKPHENPSQLPVPTPEPELSQVANSPVVPTDTLEEPEFSYDGYQIIRGEYFAHINEPCVTISDYKISVNNACLKKAPNVTYVLALINPETHKFVLRPCQEDVKDSFCWRTTSGKPRYITCKGFYVMLIQMLNWNPDYRYKLLGKMVRSNDEFLFVFDLDSPMTYRRQIITDKAGKTKTSTSRSPLYPENGENQFGMSVAEHQKAVQINIFDGYAVFGIKDTIKAAHTGSKEGDCNE